MSHPAPPERPSPYSTGNQPARRRLSSGGPVEHIMALAGCTCPAPRQARLECKRCGADAIARNDDPVLAEQIVSYIGNDAGPPGFAIAAAETAAAMSPCAKSRRGAAFYQATHDMGDGTELARQTRVDGYNGPPWVWSRDQSGDQPSREMACDASEACRRDCAKRCLHAEERALLALATTRLLDNPSDLRLVHVKIGADGRVVPGKGPSCTDCSKKILDMGIGGIWLFEKQSGLWYRDGKLGDPPGRWAYYPAEEFHAISSSATGLYQVKVLR